MLNNGPNGKKITENDDDFWDLGKLLPKSKDRLYKKPDYDTEAVLISSDAPIGNKERKVETIPRRAERKVLYSYCPENPFISNVSVLQWPTKYGFYEKFRKDVKKYHGLTHGECPEISFFSYIPQYSEMNGKQLNFYLWWRENAIKGNYINASYSYIMLFIYEIINSPELIEPNEALNLLTDIWLHYRTQYPHLDKYLSEWVCDFCLINRLAPPVDRLKHIISEINRFCSFREFYISETSNSASATAAMLCSDYDLNKCKEINDGNRDYYELHVYRAIEYVLNSYIENEGGISKIAGEVNITRDAFSGALCAYDVKKNIEISYLSFSRSSDFKLLVTEMIKYSINVIRQSLGIKNRFTVKNVNPYIKALLNSYFDSARENGSLYSRKKNTVEQKTEFSEYDKYYEPVKEEFSLEFAKEQELKAREITDILTDEFENDIIDKTENIPYVPLESNTLSGEALIENGIKLLLCGDTNGFNALAKASNLLVDALIEKINEAAMDRIGDVIIENNGNGYKIIMYYQEEIKEWMKI